ncbi:MAG: chromosomal replication initiator protein DnaA [Hyphomicrobiaceae bacterium]
MKNTVTSAADGTGKSTDVVPATATTPALSPKKLADKWTKTQKQLRTKVGEDVFNSWFGRMEVVSIEGGRMNLSVPTKFLKNWIQNHYLSSLEECCVNEFKGVESIELFVRRPGGDNKSTAIRESAEQQANLLGSSPSATNAVGSSLPDLPGQPAGSRTEYGGFEGSPLDSKYTFETFVVGASNRLAHAAARQVSETLMEKPLRFNPLYVHSSVGLGKTHLLHAVAWDVRRRHPSAQVLYLTAERFRYRFVEALKSRDALAFKETLRGIDILLIDDMEFLHGEKTEQEFDHTLNSLLDSGKQVVVASARAPSQLESLDPRMRSRLSGGLVTEISALDYELRLKVLAKRAEEKSAADPSFQLTDDVVQFLASKLTESGRELDGAVTRLYAACHLTGTPITIDTAEHIIRDLMRGMEPKRIKIDDILKLVSKHYGISRNDILSQRRHRSIVWPRQIGMYLSKKLTSRSLPEIGRRFGGRDHTTVLHAIRKIENELNDNTQLKDELDDLKRLLNS